MTSKRSRPGNWRARIEALRALKAAELAIERASNHFTAGGGASARYVAALGILRATAVALCQYEREPLEDMMQIAHDYLMAVFRRGGTMDSVGPHGMERSLETFEDAMRAAERRADAPLLFRVVPFAFARSEYAKALRTQVEGVIAEGIDRRELAVLLFSMLTTPTSPIGAELPESRNAVVTRERLAAVTSALEKLSDSKGRDAEALIRAAARALGYPAQKTKSLFEAEGASLRRIHRPRERRRPSLH